MPLTEVEGQVILELNIFQHCKKGTVLLKEGQYPSYGYFVQKGCILG